MAPDDGHVEVSAQLSSEEGVTNECIYRGTHTGPLATPTGEIAPTGQPFELPFAEVWRIRDGKIASIHGYIDSGTIMQQLGLGPPTEA
jgi:ketosteroid isomerase-like protein